MNSDVDPRIICRAALGAASLLYECCRGMIRLLGRSGSGDVIRDELTAHADTPVAMFLD